MKKVFTLLFMVVVLFSTVNIFGQAAAELKGKVVSGDETLIGANVVAVHSDSQQRYGTITDVNGNYKIADMKTGAYKVTVSFIGYEPKELETTLSGGANTLDADLNASDIGIAEVSVLASVAIDRKTPVAVSSIPAELIEDKLGTQEFPEVLKSTPGVYATKQGGGFGDSRINMRGFESANIAVMINGIPINDMEWGGVYWSNWAGLSDVTRSMQTQRGLGAAKISAPSVGGSINILTKTTDMKKGGSFYSTVGNDGYKKTSVTLSTGLMKNGFAVTFSGSRTTGDGYIMGTKFEGYSYFLNIAKQINSNHQLSFTAFGAPQWHDQRSRYDAKTIEQWRNLKDGYKYNATYGFDINGQYLNSSHNFYHKPQLSLNHYWTINEKATLSTALYASIATGGGWGARGNERSRLYGSNDEDRTIDGYRDYGKIQLDNNQNPAGAQAIIANSNNDHQWYGLLSTFNIDLNEQLNLTAGIDGRYYVGTHNRTIENLLGGKFFHDPDRVNSNILDNYEELKEGDVIGRDYDGIVLSGGLFTQLEYTVGKLSSFIAMSGTNTNYQRKDRFYYNNETSKTYSFLGGTLKGGANYNINDHHNVFANLGLITRAPYFSNVFTAKDVSNVANEDAVNEKIYSYELGYGYRSPIWFINLNGYYTIWNDKAMTGLVDRRDPDAGSYNMTGVNAIHKGVELDVKIKPITGMTVRAMLSVGDWRWQDNVEALIFNRDGQPVDANGNIVPVGSDQQNKVVANIENVHVGDAAQTTAALGVDYYIVKNLKIGIDYNYYARLYAKPSSITSLKGADTWEVPDYGVVDANLKYKFSIGTFRGTAYAKVMNLLNETYIADAYGNDDNWRTVGVFYGFGRTWSLGLKFNF